MAASSALERYISNEEKKSGRPFRTAYARAQPEADEKYSNLDSYLEHELNRSKDDSKKSKSNKSEESIVMEIERFINIRLPEYSRRRKMRLRF